MLQQIANAQGDTITLKEITDMIGTRHNDAKLTVQRMAADPTFGSVTMTHVAVTLNNNAQRQIETYVLTKRQSLMVVAYLKVSAVGFLVDYWIAREASQLNANQAVQTLMQQVAQLQDALAIETAKHKSTRDALVTMQHFDDSAL